MVERVETGDNASPFCLPLTMCGEVGVDFDIGLLFLPSETRETEDRDFTGFPREAGSTMLIGAEGQIDSSSTKPGCMPACKGILDRRLPPLLSDPPGVCVPDRSPSGLPSLRMLIARMVSSGLSVAGRVGFD